MELLPGVRAETAGTDRLRVHSLEAGPADGTPVVLVHVAALLRSLGIDAPPLLAGWSTGGAAVACFAIDRPAAPVTLIDPVSPDGFSGCHLDGTPCAPDWAGTGGGTGNPPTSQDGSPRAPAPTTRRSAHGRS